MSRRGPRITVLDSWLRAPSRGSGTAVAVSALARGLRERGVRVDTLRPRGSGSAGIARRVLFNLAVGRSLRREPPDLAVGVDLDGFLLRPGHRPCPLVVQLKGVAVDEARFERGLPRRKLQILAALEARNAREADLVVVPSRYSARVAVARYGLDPARVAVVPEGIDVDFWMEEPPRRPAGDAPVILSVARQYPRKDTRTLLEALPRVVAAAPGVRLRVVGGGPELPRLRRLANRLGLDGHVRFLGPTDSPEALREEYRSATCFCLPSRQEGFGIVFLEAMAAGLPIVAARAAAVPEVVPDGEAGLLVEPGEPAELAAALLRVLGDEPLRARMRGAGRARAPRFSLSEVADIFLRSVESLVGGSLERTENLP